MQARNVRFGPKRLLHSRVQGFLAMQRVIPLGYRRIGFVRHRGWDHSVDQLWSAGYLCAPAEPARAPAIPTTTFVEGAWFNGDPCPCRDV